MSVVVTTYNQAAYIEEALRSACEQTYPHKEVIVVDDGSSDDTPDRVKAFLDEVIYVRQHNQGSALSRNAGIRRSQGELIAFLDGDDVWEPEKLAVQVEAAREHPGSGLLVVDGVKFGEGGVLGHSLFGRCAAEFYARAEETAITEDCYPRLLNGNFVSTSSQVMVPAAVFRTVGLSDARFRIGSDYDLYLRIAARYQVTIIKRRLTRWRYHASSASGPEGVRELRWLEDIIEVLKTEVGRAPEEYRPVVRALVKRRIRTAAKLAYYYGCQVARGWATRYLLRLQLRNLGGLASVPFLAALWCPRPVVRRFGASVRRMIGAVESDF